jgi:GTPase SAR1 family protein
MSRGRGVFVVLAGPDGSGKSTLAPRLVSRAEEEGRPVRHLHWRPGLLPQAGALVGRPPVGDPSAPHADRLQGKILSLIRLAYYWVDFLVGTWIRILPVRRRRGVVVMERGWWDIAVDPRRYNLRGYPNVVRFLGRLLSPPDIVFVLEAPSEVLTGRKEELPSPELARQNDRWRVIQLPRRTAKVFLDATMSVDELAAEAWRQMDEASAAGAVGARGEER